MKKKTLVHTPCSTLSSWEREYTCVCVYMVMETHMYTYIFVCIYMCMIYLAETDCVGENTGYQVYKVWDTHWNKTQKPNHTACLHREHLSDWIFTVWMYLLLQLFIQKMLETGSHYKGQAGSNSHRLNHLNTGCVAPLLGFGFILTSYILLSSISDFLKTYLSSLKYGNKHMEKPSTRGPLCISSL